MSPTEGATFPLVAVAIDKDKGSQNALKWALDNIVDRGQTITLIHVNTKHPAPGHQEDPTFAGSHSKDLFVPFRCFCTRKNVQCKDIILEDTEIAKAIIEFVSHAAIEKLVVGAPSKSGFGRRFRTTDVSTSISKGAPDFCTVYIISKGKVSSMRNAVRAAPAVSPFRAQIQNQTSIRSEHVDPHHPHGVRGEAALENWNVQSEREPIRSPFTRGTRVLTGKSYTESIGDSDISFVSGGRPSINRIFNQRSSNMSDGLDSSFEMQSPHKSVGGGFSCGTAFSSMSQDSTPSSLTMEDVEAEMKRLRLELKQTMDMYSTACKEALTAKQKAKELHHWKMEEERRLEEAHMAEEAALALAEKEKARCKAAIEAAEASKRIAKLEAHKRINAEMKALKEAEEKKRALDALAHTDVRYRKYTIEEIEVATEYFSEKRKIGEGGYGPVYKCYLEHTPVAIKVLRPDAAQGRSQFQQEVEILSCMRHPNMVLLLGACPEYGCLVYEYMANGSLEDRLFQQGNTPPIPWQHRFRIAAEIGTGLLFLHQTKPEPLVHRDLKPANILLDRNYVSKISDVGLARLVPPSVAENVTQYRMTSTAGTFCYIDPEYQQSGMLGVKSDIYSLGIVLLQLITARPPMGLTHHVEHAIEKGTFTEVLDPSVIDWPVEEALSLANIALNCAELRRKDRPDLATIVLPELERLRNLAEENMQHCASFGSSHTSPIHSQVSFPDVLSPLPGQSGYESSITRSSASSMYGR
ncbi:U-box domain-containing protein 35 isoform X1 [Phoenix dactylifera]|uniref:RING-type E3 ubiquitin transferase n=1 Tax=Phoenix dactylifera TaxID=42345 RepID=A0A8B8J127_PHODC|nr:U-box domain-containing protein 35 isoform X1 [Phoenix dactylifera]XP_026658158.1 U-box domain-containing protein 35 isoform X1 [Phoenix dactylifera]